MAPSLAVALGHLRKGDLAGARAEAERGLVAEPEEPHLLSLAGLLALRHGDLARAVELLENAWARWPEDAATRLNLATALVGRESLGRAIEVADGAADPRLARIAGWAHARLGQPVEAASAYERVIAALPTDWEAWNNWGNALHEAGDPERAAVALREAYRLRPDVVQIHLNLARALSTNDRHEEARDVLRHAAAIAPTDALVQGELGLVEAAMRDLPAAERAFRASIDLSEGFCPSYIELGLMLESLNRLNDLQELLEKAETRGVAERDVSLIRAWLLIRRGRVDEAETAAALVTDDINPVRRHHVRGDIAHRLGDTATAFAEFTAMNAAALAAAPLQHGPTYIEDVRRISAALTPARVASWKSRKGVPALPAPVFVMGFPRSGTTLLDTLLMNDPRFHVAEELPIFRQIREDAENDDLDPEPLRARYYDAIATILPGPAGAIVVDKHPLHMARISAIHRVFPDASIILCERHPCDAVLSCFMQNFEMNRAMRFMTSLESAAELYDAVFEGFAKAEALLPLRLHRVRYERMVVDLESEMRALLAFLSVSWNPAVLDNQTSAAKRTHIRTASYAQVGQPIYTSATGRWMRYREYLTPVLPILQPWCERMGYPLA